MAPPSALKTAILLLSCLAVQACGKLVQFEVKLTWEIGAPDGQEREMAFLNGQFPGPVLELDFGDDVEFVMDNQLPYNCTMHFHGIDQLGTAWSDGVPGLTQYPVPPGVKFKYKWKATQYGTFMYHAHDASLIQDGIYGSIYVRPSLNEPSALSQISSDPNDLQALAAAERDPQLIMLSDWTKFTSTEYFAAELASNLDLYCLDSLLVNGKGAVNCQTPEFLKAVTPATTQQVLQLAGTPNLTDKGCLPPSKLVEGAYEYDTSKIPTGLLSGCTPTTGSLEVIQADVSLGWISLNFVSAASITTFAVSIDMHPMWVYSVDGGHIVPKKADALQLSNGQRYSVMIKLDKPVGDYSIRVASAGANQVISGYAVLSYTDVISAAHLTSPPPPGRTSTASYGSTGGQDCVSCGSSKPQDPQASAPKRHRSHSRDLDPLAATPNSTASINYAGQPVNSSVVVLDETLLPPFPASAPAPTADAIHVIELGRVGAPYIWGLNMNESMPSTYAYDAPLLYNPTSNAALNSNLTIRTLNNTWVDIVLHLSPTERDSLQPSHAIHKHSNRAYIIGSGTGNWTWPSVQAALAEAPQFFNLANPPLRDMFNTPPMVMQPVWTVVRYQVVNPGPFLFHCHIQTHLQGGMAIALMDGVDHWPVVPREYQPGGNGY